jgi:Ca-activated chloride channel homolog
MQNLSLEIVQPVALFGLLLLPLFVLLNRFSRSHLAAHRRRVALLVRLVVVALLVFAASGPRLVQSADRLATAFLLDFSDSVSPDVREQAVAFVRQALLAKRDGDQAVVIAFGEHAQVDQPLGSFREISGVTSVVPGGHTNIAEAIRLGLASLPTGVARQIVLLSDGNENVEKALEQARLVAATHVPISTVTLGGRSSAEVLVRQVDTPSFVREGESFSVSVTIESSVQTAGKLHLLSDNQLLSTQDVELEPGTNTINVPQEPLGAGFHLFRAQIETSQDTYTQNNESGSYTVVQGKPRVLLVEGETGEARYLADALTAGGLSPDVRGAAEAPLDLAGLRAYESVVLVNVPANKLSSPQMKSIQSYVQNLGGGLVVVGGDKSFGVGRYARTPLEDALPVKMDLRGKTLTASVALVLVIDASGSMAGGPGASKMDLAKEAAIRATELLGDQDQLGVISFDDTPKWVIEMQNLTEPASVQAAIGSISPGGGTAIYPALETAYDALIQREAKVKHVILLTDGLSAGGDYDQLTARMRAQNITLSSIAVGSDADFQLLRRIAEIGKGRYYEGNDPFDLPQLVVKETQEVARAAIVEEPTKLSRVGASPLLDDFNVQDMPALYGYVSTTPKPSSQVLLVSPQVDPVLSEWQYGLGRVVVWTSDAKNRWAQDWVNWPDFGRFWAAAVKRTIPSPIDRNNQVSVAPESNGVKITVDSVADDKSYVNFVQTHATLVRPDQQQSEIELPQVAPGRYEAQVPASTEGPYFLNIVQQGPDGQALVGRPAGFVVPYSPEYRTLRPNPDLLNQLAQATNGRTLAEASLTFDHSLPAEGSPREIWPLLVGLASLLFLFDIALRRLRLALLDLRQAGAQVAARLLGTAQAVAGPAQTRLLAAKDRIVVDTPTLTGQPGQQPPSSGTRAASSSTPAANQPASASALSTRLLEAKKRVGRD